MDSLMALAAEPLDTEAVLSGIAEMVVPMGHARCSTSLAGRRANNGPVGDRSVQCGAREHLVRNAPESRYGFSCARRFSLGGLVKSAQGLTGLQSILRKVFRAPFPVISSLYHAPLRRPSVLSPLGSGAVLTPCAQAATTFRVGVEECAGFSHAALCAAPIGGGIFCVHGRIYIPTQVLSPGRSVQ